MHACMSFFSCVDWLVSCDCLPPPPPSPRTPPRGGLTWHASQVRGESRQEAKKKSVAVRAEKVAQANIFPFCYFPSPTLTNPSSSILVCLRMRKRKRGETLPAAWPVGREREEHATKTTKTTKTPDLTTEVSIGGGRTEKRASRDPAMKTLRRRRRRRRYTRDSVVRCCEKLITCTTTDAA